MDRRLMRSRTALSAACAAISVVWLCHKGLEVEDESVAGSSGHADQYVAVLALSGG